ncbi:recombinase family protein, partial [Vibrio sp. FNV 38]|nr:recombinase family protein [Vibrio sp. FNV 38]
YYNDYIRKHDNWQLAEIYADEGITGTSAAKRDDFQRMLSDCRKGRIDKVLVKSISRFARNTKECLESIRELKALGISVFFEEHNIDTRMVTSEMLTAILASCDQAESESISKNMRWSYQKRMLSGTYIPTSV